MVRLDHSNQSPFSILSKQQTAFLQSSSTTLRTIWTTTFSERSRLTTAMRYAAIIFASGGEVPQCSISLILLSVYSLQLMSGFSIAVSRSLNSTHSHFAISGSSVISCRWTLNTQILSQESQHFGESPEGLALHLSNRSSLLNSHFAVWLMTSSIRLGHRSSHPQEVSFPRQCTAK